MLKPKISMIFPNMAPMMEAFTRSIRPAFMAIRQIIISAAFPNVTFKSEPAVDP